MFKRSGFFMILVLLTLLAFSLTAFAQDEATPPATEEVAEVTPVDEAPVVVTEAPDAPPIDEAPVDNDEGWLAAISAFSTVQIVLMIIIAVLAVLAVAFGGFLVIVARWLKELLPRWAWDELKENVPRVLDTVGKRVDIAGTTFDDELRQYINDRITSALDQAEIPAQLSPRP